MSLVTPGFSNCLDQNLSLLRSKGYHPGRLTYFFYRYRLGRITNHPINLGHLFLI
jgi:hypothetical protein